MRKLPVLLFVLVVAIPLLRVVRLLLALPYSAKEVSGGEE